jgi:hypothetical protein
MSQSPFPAKANSRAENLEAGSLLDLPYVPVILVFMTVLAGLSAAFLIL